METDWTNFVKWMKRTIARYTKRSTHELEVRTGK